MILRQKSYNYLSYYLLFLIISTITTVILSKSIFTRYSNRCPSGWDLNLSTKHCYRLINRPMPQIYAQKYCNSLDPKAKLVKIQDKDENNFIQEYTYSGDVWLEAKAKFDIIDAKASLFSPGLVLRWKNGKPVKYANWETRNGLSRMDSEHLCVIMNKRGKWANADCSDKANFVCERKMNELSFEEPSDCPRKWIYNPRTSSCYRTYTGTKNVTWLDADKLCGDSATNSIEEPALTSIVDVYENKFVMDLARKRLPNWQYIFLGAIGESKSKKLWDWVDGNKFKAFSNWDINMPRGSRRQAVLAMTRSGRWINTYADRALPGRIVVICKFQPN